MLIWNYIYCPSIWTAWLHYIYRHCILELTNTHINVERQHVWRRAVLFFWHGVAVVEIKVIKALLLIRCDVEVKLKQEQESQWDAQIFFKSKPKNGQILLQLRTNLKSSQQYPFMYILPQRSRFCLCSEEDMYLLPCSVWVIQSKSFHAELTFLRQYAVLKHLYKCLGRSHLNISPGFRTHCK